MNGVDLDKVYDRFKLDLDLIKQLQLEDMSMRLNEKELKEIIYLLGELKAIREKHLDKWDIEKIREEMCDDYCRFPREYQDCNALGIICDKCPMNRLEGADDGD